MVEHEARGVANLLRRVDRVQHERPAAAPNAEGDECSTPTRSRPRTTAERVLLLDEKLRAIDPPQGRAAAAQRLNLWLLASSLDEPHRYIEGTKNVQANIGTVSALIFSVTIGCVLEPPSNETAGGGSENDILLQLHLCLMVASSLALWLSVVIATIVYTQVELLALLSDPDDVLDALLFDMSALRSESQNSQNFFIYGSGFALIGCGIKVAMVHGWRSPPSTLYLVFATAILGALYRIWRETVVARRVMMRRSFEKRLADATAEVASASTAGLASAATADERHRDEDAVATGHHEKTS